MLAKEDFYKWQFGFKFLQQGLCGRQMLKCFCGSNCYGYQMLSWSGGGGKWRSEVKTGSEDLSGA